MLTILSALHQGIVGAISILLMYALYYGGKGIVRLMKKSKSVKNSVLEPQPTNDSEPIPPNPIKRINNNTDYNITYTTSFSSEEPSATKRKGRIRRKRSTISIIGYALGTLSLISIVVLVIALNNRENNYEEITAPIRSTIGTCYVDDNTLFGDKSLAFYIMEDMFGAAMQYRVYKNSTQIRTGLYDYASSHKSDRLSRLPYLKDRYYTDLWGNARGIDSMNDCGTIEIDKHPNLQGKTVFAFRNTIQSQSAIGAVSRRPCYTVYILDSEIKPNSRIYELTAIGMDNHWADNHIAHMLYNYPLCDMSGRELRKDNKMPDGSCRIIVCLCSMLFALMTILFFKKNR